MSQLMCGAAKRLITPPEEMWPLVCGMLNAPIGKVLDDLYVRSICVQSGADRFLIVSFDLGDNKDPQVNIPLISEKTGIPQENILMFVIHTHSSCSDKGNPGNGAKRGGRNPDEPRPFPPSDGAYSLYVRKQLLDCVQEAVASLRPARMGYGFGESFLNVNRNVDYILDDGDGSLHHDRALGQNFKKVADPTLFVMKFEDLSGKPIAFFVNYAVHCVVMIWNNVGDGKIGISGDIGGNTSRCLEEKFEGAIAVWSSGAAGDLNPKMMNQSYYPDPKDGASVLHSIPNVDTPLMMLKLQYTQHVADIMKVIRGIDHTVDHAAFATAQCVTEAPKCSVDFDENGDVRFTRNDARPTVKVPMHLFKLGTLAIVGVTGEPYIERGHEIQEASPMRDTIIVNHTARTDRVSCGYLFDDETYLACMKAKNAKKKEFTLMQDNFVPGVEGFSAMPGTVTKALREKTRELFEQVLL